MEGTFDSGLVADPPACRVAIASSVPSYEPPTAATSSVSFLLLFFIRHVQCRESKAVHLKLDELIYAAKNARNELISIEHLTEEQLDRLGRQYLRLSEHHRGVLPPDGAPADA